MADGDGVRLERIAGKLAAARARPGPPTAFGAEAHGFELGPPLPEADVREFEERHGVALPQGYRSFLTELGHGGAGPGYGLTRLDAACCRLRRSGHLTRPSPYLPGPRYLDDWQSRYEAAPGPDGVFLPGTLRVADHGCSLATRLVVTGPARGRLVNLDEEGPIGPYVVEDADFLAWYERWLDEAVAGYDVGFFGERLPLTEPELVAVLADDPSPARRTRAGTSLLQLPVLGDGAWAALVAAVAGDEDAGVRAGLWHPLRWRHHRHRRRLDDAEATADAIARHARARTPPDLGALATLDRLTAADVLPELAADDVERRRRAASRVVLLSWGSEDDRPPDVLHDVARRLLLATDPPLRSHGVAVVDDLCLTDLHPLLRELQETEPDAWVRHDIHRCLTDRRWEKPTQDPTVDLQIPPF